MNPKNNPGSAERASALDALLHRGVQADQRATKPSIPVPTGAPTAKTTPPPPAVAAPRPQAPKRSASPLETFERLTIRFSPQEARIIEQARAIARSMGYKISDNAVFRLALNAFKPESLTAQSIESILATDGRRRQ